MKYKEKNFSRCDIAQAQAGDEFIDCNLSQKLAGTVISLEKGLIFRGCNLVNVAIDPSWIVDDCNTFQGDIIDEPEIDPIDQEINQAVEKIAELSFKYPTKVSEKLKGKVDKSTTEGLLSADGVGIEIVEKDGKWKA